MNIGVIGVGGVGGYFGGKLTRSSNAQVDAKVYFVARNEHLAQIIKHGLILSTAGDGESVCLPTRATDNPAELPQLDLCLICTKSYDLPKALAALKNNIGSNTIVIPLLNGADIYDRVRVVLKIGTVLPACAYLGTHVERPGKVTQKGGSCTIFFGKDPQNTDLLPSKVFDLFNFCGINYQWRADPLPEIWSKYVFIAAYGMVTAGENKTLGQVRESTELSQKVIAIMKETVAIAHQLGIALPATIVEDSFHKGASFPYETKTSFQRDFELLDRRDERELYGPTIIRLGALHGVATPATQQATEQLEELKASCHQPSA